MNIIKEFNLKENFMEFSELSMVVKGVKIIERICKKNRSAELQIEFCKLPHYSPTQQHWCIYQYLNDQLPQLLDTHNISNIFSFSGESFSLGNNFFETCFSRDEQGSLEYLIVHSPLKPKEIEGYESFIPFEQGIYLYKISPFKIGKINLMQK